MVDNERGRLDLAAVFVFISRKGAKARRSRNIGSHKDTKRARADADDRSSSARSAFQGRLRRRMSLTVRRSEEHTSELQSLMRISYAVLCLKKKKQTNYRHERA